MDSVSTLNIASNKAVRTKSTLFSVTCKKFTRCTFFWKPTQSKNGRQLHAPGYRRCFLCSEFHLLCRSLSYRDFVHFSGFQFLIVDPTQLVTPASKFCKSCHLFLRHWQGENYLLSAAYRRNLQVKFSGITPLRVTMDYTENLSLMTDFQYNSRLMWMGFFFFFWRKKSQQKKAPAKTYYFLM